MSPVRPTTSSTERPAHPEDAPTVSVVVASGGAPDVLRGLLAALAPTCEAHGVEVLVVCGGPEDDAPAVAAEHPGAYVLRAPGGAPAAALRSLGMRAARGDVVLLADAHDPAAPERLRHLLRTHGYAVAEPAGEEVPPEGQDVHVHEGKGGNAWLPRRPGPTGGWTVSPRVTGSSSSEPAPAV